MQVLQNESRSTPSFVADTAKRLLPLPANTNIKTAIARRVLPAIVSNIAASG
jgi:hypothetical protein